MGPAAYQPQTEHGTLNTAALKESTGATTMHAGFPLKKKTMPQAKGFFCLFVLINLIR